MLLKDPSGDILVDLHPEGMGYLLGYLQAPEPRILPFHRYDGLDQLLLRSFGAGLSPPFRTEQ